MDFSVTIGDMSIGRSIGLDGSRLPVGVDVEVDEQSEVAREQCTAENCSTFRSSAISDVGEAGSVGGGKVGVTYRWGENKLLVLDRQKDAGG